LGLWIFLKFGGFYPGFTDNEAGDACAEEVFKNVNESLAKTYVDRITEGDHRGNPGAITVNNKPVYLGKIGHGVAQKVVKDLIA
jgi:hypothetical protein